jgi:hypothetical protein
MAQISASELQAIASVAAALAAGIAGWIGGRSGKKQDAENERSTCDAHGETCAKLSLLPQILQSINELKDQLNAQDGIFNRLRTVESKTAVLDALRTNK